MPQIQLLSPFEVPQNAFQMPQTLPVLSPLGPLVLPLLLLSSLSGIAPLFFLPLSLQTPTEPPLPFQLLSSLPLPLLCMSPAC